MASCGHLQVVQYLVGQGADIHAREDDVLRFSIRSNHVNVARILVQQ
jgi:hypothetical protein